MPQPTRGAWAQVAPLRDLVSIKLLCDIVIDRSSAYAVSGRLPPFSDRRDLADCRSSPRLSVRLMLLQ